MRGTIRIILAVVIVAALAGGAGAWYWHSNQTTKPLWRTGVVRQGNLPQALITATGTVEPEEVVDVGAQVSGQFMEFGRDKNGRMIDYGSIVESNMLLAKIDPGVFQADVDLDTAMLASDKAGEAQAEANVEQSKASSPKRRRIGNGRRYSARPRRAARRPVP